MYDETLLLYSMGVVIVFREANALDQMHFTQ